MGKFLVILVLVLVFLITGCSSASATPAAKIVGGVVTNVVSALFKWLWSLKSTPKTAISSRSLMKFEGGYTVETMFDGSKLGIEPHSVEVSPSGELFVLDSKNSNIYKISAPLSRCEEKRQRIAREKKKEGSLQFMPKEESKWCLFYI